MINIEEEFEIEKQVPRLYEELTGIYDTLEEMTPPEVRVARQILGQMARLWEVAAEQAERIEQLESDLLKALAKTERVTVLEGALEELIARVEDLRRGNGKAVPTKRRKRVKGIYCRHCAKVLDTKNQTIFCSRKCAKQWRDQHPGLTAKPRFEIKEKPEAVVEAGAGLISGSVSNGGNGHDQG